MTKKIQIKDIDKYGEDTLFILSYITMGSVIRETRYFHKSPLKKYLNENNYLMENIRLEVEE